MRALRRDRPERARRGRRPPGRHGVGRCLVVLALWSAAVPAPAGVAPATVAGLADTLAVTAASTASSASAQAAAPAASASPAPITVRDERGRTFHFDRPPARIVALLPSLTESVCALGGCDRLVGVDRYSNAPPEVERLPKLGGLEDTQVERLVALRPDVVLSAKSARVTDRLEALGLTVVLIEAQSHAEVERSLQLIGTLLGRPEAATRLWQGIQREIDAAATRVPPQLHGARVYFEVASAPYAAGTTSFIGETLSRLGLGNIVPPALGPFPKLNPEYVVRSRPDVVMALQRELEAMPSRPGWGGLAAIRQGRSCGFPLARYDLLVRPGPRMGEAAGLVADCLVRLAAAGR